MRIAEWCASTYMLPGEARSHTLHQTQGYLKDALLTVAQHITLAGQALTTQIDQQCMELEGVDAMVPLPPPTHAAARLHPRSPPRTCCHARAAIQFPLFLACLWRRCGW